MVKYNSRNINTTVLQKVKAEEICANVLTEHLLCARHEQGTFNVFTPVTLL